ncbi:hypothetical protein ACHAWF_007068 [Thalassiosira exigua]
MADAGAAHLRALGRVAGYDDFLSRTDDDDEGGGDGGGGGERHVRRPSLPSIEEGAEVATAADASSSSSGGVCHRYRRANYAYATPKVDHYASPAVAAAADASSCASSSTAEQPRRRVGERNDIGPQAAPNRNATSRKKDQRRKDKFQRFVAAKQHRRAKTLKHSSDASCASASGPPPPRPDVLDEFREIREEAERRADRVLYSRGPRERDRGDAVGAAPAAVRGIDEVVEEDVADRAERHANAVLRRSLVRRDAVASASLGGIRPIEEDISERAERHATMVLGKCRRQLDSVEVPTSPEEILHATGEEDDDASEMHGDTAAPGGLGADSVETPQGLEVIRDFFHEADDEEVSEINTSADTAPREDLAEPHSAESPTSVDKLPSDRVASDEDSPTTKTTTTGPEEEKKIFHFIRVESNSHLKGIMQYGCGGGFGGLDRRRGRSSSSSRPKNLTWWDDATNKDKPFTLKTDESLDEYDDDSTWNRLDDVEGGGACGGASFRCAPDDVPEFLLARTKRRGSRYDDDLASPEDEEDDDGRRDATYGDDDPDDDDDDDSFYRHVPLDKESCKIIGDMIEYHVGRLEDSLSFALRTTRRRAGEDGGGFGGGQLRSKSTFDTISTATGGGGGDEDDRMLGLLNVDLFDLSGSFLRDEDDRSVGGFSVSTAQACTNTSCFA